MITLLEVARVNSQDSSCLVISVDKKLGPLSLSGITDWSHIWIVFVLNSQTRCTVAQLVSCQGRSLTVKLSEPWIAQAIIVDIKPYHFLENLN